MPQLVVNMKVNTQNIISRSLKMMGSKMRQAPYLNRWQQDERQQHIWFFLPTKANY
jgi:hypothetical protein